MRPRLTWLDATERDLVYQSALAILERVGLRLRGSARLPELAEAGALVDPRTGVVRFPAETVERALRSTPGSFVMAGLAEADDVVLGEGRPTAFCPSGCAALTLDEETGERRPSTMEDLRRATILFDETPEVEVLWTTVTANDVPRELRELAEYLTVFGETRKHVTLVDCPELAEPVIEMAAVLSGDMERFACRPRFSTLLTVASPLQIEGRLLDFHATMASIGAPVEVYTLPMTGGTGPITVAGTLTLGLAEFLGASAALQVLSPGARLVWGASGTVLDMRTTQISYAAPESIMLSAAAVDLAHHLGVPIICSGLASDAKEPGLQAGYEKALKGLATAASGADLMSGGVGMLDSANLFFLPQVVLDAEIVGMIHRLLRGAEVSAETLMLDAVERVGIGGSFLGERETRRRYRTGEHFVPSVSTRLSYEAWKEQGRDPMSIGRERVAQVLGQRSQPLPYYSDDQRAALATLARDGAAAR
jgi:trimethylamine--corrinoid protein Co-methyltransferase